MQPHLAFLLTVALKAPHATITHKTTPTTSTLSYSHARPQLRTSYNNLKMSHDQPQTHRATRHLKVELIAQQALAPAEQQQQSTSVGVPPPGTAAPAPLAQRAKAPFVAITLLATATVAGWQSKRLYNKRQRELLDEFARTMLYHLGDVPEMGATIRAFRSQLGPGKYRGQMFVAFAKAVATSRPLSVDLLKHMQAAVQLMQLSEEALAQLYVMCADELESQPSVLGKLLFVAERATPAAARAAGLRGRFPSWSEETVGALQDAMVGNLYKGLCEPLSRGDAPPPGAAELLISDADARRFFDEVQDAKDEAAAEKKRASEEKARAAKLEDAIKRASETNTIPTRPGDEDK